MQAIPGRAKVSELESRTRVLESRAAGVESKLADVGDAQKGVAASVYEYKEELNNTASTTSSIAAALSLQLEEKDCGL